MKLFLNCTWFLYKIIAVYTIIVLILCYWTPTSHWFAGFVMMSYPVVLAVNGLFFLFWIATRSRQRATLAGVLLFIQAAPFMGRTFRLPFFLEKKVAEGRPVLKVLNLNARNFGYYGASEWSYPIEEEIQILGKTGADVICFQESIHHKKFPKQQIISKMRAEGYSYFVFFDRKIGVPPSFANGLSVFSKFPIIDRSEASFGQQNGYISTQIKWNKDTVTVINVHLHSMTVRLGNLFKQRDYEGIKAQLKHNYHLLKQGFILRNVQVMELLEAVKESRFPVILCGDLNETPYSFVYGVLRKELANGFEAGGKGFGFTYNQIPSFIRIDNQFYQDKAFELVDFETYNKLYFSDHFPVSGSYVLKSR